VFHLIIERTELMGGESGLHYKFDKVGAMKPAVSNLRKTLIMYARMPMPYWWRRGGGRRNWLVVVVA
jgi:hypothetical protein